MNEQFQLKYNFLQSSIDISPSVYTGTIINSWEILKVKRTVRVLSVIDDN